LSNARRLNLTREAIRDERRYYLENQQLAADATK